MNHLYYSETDDIMEDVRTYQNELLKLDNSYYGKKPLNADLLDLDKNQIIPIQLFEAGKNISNKKGKIHASDWNKDDEIIELFSSSIHNVDRIYKMNELLKKTVKDLDQEPNPDDVVEIRNKQLELQILQIR